MTIRVILADDQGVIRDALALLLSTAGDIEVVAAVADGAEALTAALAEQPDVALLDLQMPVMTGVEATAAIAAQAPQVRVLILTTYADDDAILPALRAGALGYLTKNASSEELVDAIRHVAVGHTVLDPNVQRRLVELLREAPVSTAPAHAADPDMGGLTRREVDIVRLVGEGLSNPLIARRLVISEATVKTHLNHILAKLDVDGRPGLVAWAFRQGLAT